MRQFECLHVDEAIVFSLAGGQALHLHQIIADWDKAPECFRREVRAGRDIAHLFDQDYRRLVTTVRSLGVRVIVVEREGTERQHIDLCGRPLQRAIAMCETDNECEQAVFPSFPYH